MKGQLLPVESHQPSQVTNILRGLSGYGESSAVTFTQRKSHIPKSYGEECCFINFFFCLIGFGLTSDKQEKLLTHSFQSAGRIPFRFVFENLNPLLKRSQTRDAH